MDTHRKVKIYRTSEYGETVEYENWPCLSEDQVKEELLNQLSGYNDTEVMSGITLSINYIDAYDTHDARYNTGINTDGIESVEEVERCIEAGAIEWLGLDEFGCRTIVEVVEGGEQ